MSNINIKDQSGHRLNLLAYPLQATVFFWVIVVVVLGVMLAGTIGPSPILMWPITLTVLILPMRAFMAWPDRELEKRQNLLATAKLTADGVLPRLQASLTQLAQDNGYREPIKIIVSATTDKMNAVGSWRRHYLFIGQEVAQRLDSDLQNPERQTVAQAALLHEIAHFYHRDVQRVGYTHELLYGSFIIILWWMIFLFGWLGFANMMGQAFLNFDLGQLADMDPVTLEILAFALASFEGARAEIAEQAQVVNMGLVLSYIVNAFLPIVVMGFFLWLFFWRRMLRIQEHYADNFVNDALQQPDALNAAWFDYQPQSLLDIRTQKLPTRLRDAWQEIYFQVTELLPFATSSWYQQLEKQIHDLRAWFSYHPTYDQRRTLLLNPMGIYGSWLSVAVTALALTLALEVLLITPLIGYHTGAYIIHFATITIFVLLSTWALPLLAQQQTIRISLRNSLLLIYGVRWAWIAFNFLLILFLAIVSPNYALEVLNSIALTGSRFAGYLTELPVDNALAIILSIIPAYMALQLLSLIAVILLLFIYLFIQQRVVQSGQMTVLGRWHWELVLCLSVATVTLSLTPLSNILQGDFDLLFRPARLLSYGAGLGCIVWLVIRVGRILWRK